MRLYAPVIALLALALLHDLAGVSLQAWGAVVLAVTMAINIHAERVTYKRRRDERCGKEG